MSGTSREPADTRLAAYLQERAPGTECLPLAGDVSTRRYFRLRLGGAARVISLMPEPFDPSESSFLAMQRLLDSWGLPVPGVHDVDGPRGIVVLDDLGDVSLQAALAEDPGGREGWYAGALDQLVRLHERSATAPQRGPCFDAAFDVAKLVWELDYFAEHFLCGHRGCRPSDSDRAALSEAFHALSTQIAAWPRVVCHRDFHSRNLMWRGGTLWWLDFQDARLGPNTYDLASLLRDSYVELPAEFVDARVEAFRRRAAPEEGAAVFQRRFELTCVQRNLKALGTFGHVGHVRGAPTYDRYVPGTLRSVRYHLERHGELAPLRRVLARYLEELR